MGKYAREKVRDSFLEPRALKEGLAYTEESTPIRNNLGLCTGESIYAVGKEVPGGATQKVSDPALDLIWSKERGREIAQFILTQHAIEERVANNFGF